MTYHLKHLCRRSSTPQFVFVKSGSGSIIIVYLKRACERTFYFCPILFNYFFSTSCIFFLSVFLKNTIWDPLVYSINLHSLWTENSLDSMVIVASCWVESQLVRAATSRTRAALLMTWATTIMLHCVKILDVNSQWRALQFQFSVTSSHPALWQCLGKDRNVFRTGFCALLLS